MMNGRPYRGFSNAEKVEMRRRRAEGETYAQIARAIGHYPKSVWQWFQTKGETQRQSPTYATERAEQRLAVATKRLEDASAQSRKRAKKRRTNASEDA